MTKVKVYNDKKEKIQSFEVWVDGIECERGYGRNVTSATKDYIEKLMVVKEKIDDSLDDLLSYNFKAVDVDCMGDEVNEQ